MTMESASNPFFYESLVFDKLFKEIVLHGRKDDVELYKLFAGDEAFKTALMQSM